MPKTPKTSATHSHSPPPATGHVVAEPAAIFAAEMAVSATVAQNEFGRILNNALQGRVIVISRHNAPSAVLISADRYRELTQGTSNRLDLLTQQFDMLVERMQSPSARVAMQSAFDASPDALSQAAATKKHSSKQK